jgi:hypothetical protein
MSLDQRARSAAADLRQQIATIEPPEHRVVLRRATHRRRVTFAVAGLAAIAAVGLGLIAAISDEPDATTLAVGAQDTPGWTRVLKEDAGLPWLEEGSSLEAVASDGRTAVLAGATYRPGDEGWNAALWWSDDGLTWHRAEHPVVGGQVGAVAIHDGTAIAAGSNFVWRSDDAGRTWTEVDAGFDLDEVVFHDGWWVASGSGAIWVSSTGDDWQRALDTGDLGSVYFVGLDGGRLLAYSDDAAWITEDPAGEWTPDASFTVPSSNPGAIAAGAALAVRDLPGAHQAGATARSDLLRSDDEGRTWQVDAAFAEQFPGVYLATATQLDGVSVLAGYDAQGSPGAWVSVDGTAWQEIPEGLRRPVGGMLALAADVDGRVVILGAAPELNRFYVFEP